MPFSSNHGTIWSRNTTILRYESPEIIVPVNPIHLFEYFAYLRILFGYKDKQNKRIANIIPFIFVYQHVFFISEPALRLLTACLLPPSTHTPTILMSKPGSSLEYGYCLVKQESGTYFNLTTSQSAGSQLTLSSSSLESHFAASCSFSSRCPLST